MKWIFLSRPLLRLLSYFIQELRKGNPYAQVALAVIVVVTLLSGFLWFARRPLGGDPEKLPVDENTFQDDKNPYRSTS